VNESILVTITLWIGSSVMVAGGVAVIAFLIAFAVEHAGRAWRSGMTWAYFTKAVNEYGNNHPEERRRAEKLNHIYRDDNSE